MKRGPARRSGLYRFSRDHSQGKKLGVTWYTIEYEVEADDLLDNIAESLRYLRNIT